MTARLAPAGCSVTVLIADDTPAIRRLVRLTFELAGGFSVVAEASDGAAAVRLAAEHHPDVVLLDLAMPVMDGLQAISGIRQSCPKTKIVVLSGFESERMGAEAIERGAHAYFEKGVRPDQLATRVAEMCGGRVAPAEGLGAARLGTGSPRLGLVPAAL